MAESSSNKNVAGDTTAIIIAIVVLAAVLCWWLYRSIRGTAGKLGAERRTIDKEAPGTTELKIGDYGPDIQLLNMVLQKMEYPARPFPVITNLFDETTQRLVYENTGFYTITKGNVYALHDKYLTTQNAK